MVAPRRFALHPAKPPHPFNAFYISTTYTHNIDRRRACKQPHPKKSTSKKNAVTT